VSRNSKILIASFAGLAVVLIAYFSFNQEGKKFQWAETYKASSDQPYGTLFIQQLLARHRSGNKFILNDGKSLQELLDTARIRSNTDYVFIGREIYLSREDVGALLKFISYGNNALISTVNLPFDILNSVNEEECEAELYLETNEVKSAVMQFYDEELNRPGAYGFRYRFAGKDQPYYWNTINPEFFCDSARQVTRLGYIHPGNVNFIRFSYGKGSLYVHTNPLAFTNYFLTDSINAAYASGVFSYLPNDSLIWDEFSRAKFTGDNNAPEMSPISYILQQDSLRYAWWLMLASVGLYVFFAARRKQRVIPVLEEKSNTSLEFIKMISALHFQSGNNHSIARKKMKYFFHFIRSKYGLRTQELTPSYVALLSEKSKIEQAQIDVLAGEFHHLNYRADYGSDQLVQLHEALYTFYKNCK